MQFLRKWWHERQPKRLLKEGNELYWAARLDDALPLLEQATQLARDLKSWPLAAEALETQGRIHRTKGRKDRAESCLREALEYWQKVGDTSKAATIQSELGPRSVLGRNFMEADPIFRQAPQLQITTSAQISHPSLGLFSEGVQAETARLNGQVVELYQKGHYQKALDLAIQVQDLVGQEWGEDHPNTATSLNNLAMLYRAMGRFAEAEPRYVRALAIHEKQLGKDHPNIATSLNNLAGLYEAMGRFAEAEPQYVRALAICEKQLGKDHPNTATSLNNLAGLYVATARAREALPLMQQAAAIDDRMIGQIFSISSENQRTAYLRTIQGSFELFLSLVSRHLPNDADAVRAALDLVLRRKAIGAEALAAQREAVLGGQYPALVPQLHTLTSLRMQIAQKTPAGPGPEGLAVHLQQLAEWNARKERLEADLARQIPEMNLERRLRAADRQAVARAMPPGVVLLEIVRFNVFDFHAVAGDGGQHWQPARYLAFVVPAGKPDDVRMVDLGAAEPIDRLIADFQGKLVEDGSRAAVALPPQRPPQPQPPPAPRNEEGLQLRAAVFDPVRDALGGCTRVFLSPDGDLTRLPFQVLPLSDGRLLMDEYRISYLSAGRDVLRFGTESSGQPGTPLVAADPDFDLTGVAGAVGSTRSGNPSTKPVLSLSKPVLSNVEGDSGRAGSRQSRDVDRGWHFDRLPWTRIEGERIAAKLGVQPWLADAALEASLKACSSPRILHLATHGHFLSDQELVGNLLRRALGLPGNEAGRLVGPGMENPMLRSFVTLAGVNSWLKAQPLPPEAEDGMLTAEDASGLDLLHTDLVTLSACNTALGEVHISEGVIGLRRAFVVAGAKTLVMSLWSVPDLATAVLMERFYDNLLTHKMRRDEALRQAQYYTRNLTVGALRADWLSPETIERLAAGNEEVRVSLQRQAQQPDTHRPFSHPYYWGAFICQGDPAPLR